MLVDELSIEEVERLAREATGFSDFGPSHYRDGLEVLLESLAVDGPMHETGFRVMRDYLVLQLSNRLKWNDWIRTNSEVNTKHLSSAPVFIVGTPRSGTTLLYNLMAFHPDVRCPVFWEALDPIPPAWDCDDAEVRKRIASMEEFLRDYNEGLPQFKAIHYLHSATQVEECSVLLGLTLRYPLMAFASWPGPRYYRWLAAQTSSSMSLAMEEYRAIVCSLMHASPGKTWLTKHPLLAPWLPLVKELFPTARIVHTHRDARERIPSFCNLNYHLHSVYRPPSAEAAREQVLFYNRLAFEGMAQGRNAAPNDTFDIDYSDLATDPLKTVASLCENLRLSVTDGFLAECRAWLDSRNPYDAKKVGKHEYDAKTFGLDLQELATLEP